MATRIRIFLTSTLIATLTACGGGTDTPASGPAETQAPAANRGSIALPRSPAADGARVFFIQPADGDTVTSPVRIEFGVEAMSLVPAGQAKMHSGHHHLIVNAEFPAPDLPIPANEHYLHFGDGSTSTSLELPPGRHTLQLLLGDYLHIPHDPPISSEVITITVSGT